MVGLGGWVVGLVVCEWLVGWLRRGEEGGREGREMSGVVVWWVGGDVWDKGEGGRMGGGEEGCVCVCGEEGGREEEAEEVWVWVWVWCVCVWGGGGRGERGGGGMEE